MAWYEKEHPTLFDKLVIPGLCFNIGDLYHLGDPWTNEHGKKSPVISFPSSPNEVFELNIDPTDLDLNVVIVSGIEVKYHDTEERAFDRLRKQLNYVSGDTGLGYYISFEAEKTDAGNIKICQSVSDQCGGGGTFSEFFLTYDNVNRQLIDIAVTIEQVSDEWDGGY